MNRRWLISRTNPEYVDYLSKASSISPILSQVLINRGIKSPGDVSAFLSTGISNLCEPFDLADLRTAVERIKVALRNDERILVSGDYDADGLTATAIMVHALKKMGADVHYFIPHRIVHGYGFNIPSVDAAKRLGAKLIITVDCGITSFDAASYAKSSGVDVIITDHHEAMKRGIGDRGLGIGNNTNPQSQNPDPGFMLPDALAVINPKISNPDSRISALSGAGVAFKLVQALAMDDALPFGADDCRSLLDLAALGTVADVVPLTCENRIIMKEGLRCIKEAYRPGIKALMEVSGTMGREVKAGLLSFTMVPRINAAGRIGDAGDVVRLFLSDSDEETLSIAEKLDRTNTERQRIEEEAYQEALLQLNKKGYDASIVLYNKGWHAGVVGIVASRIAEEFYRPAFIFSVEDNIAKGSARSIPAFDIYKGLSGCGDILISFGGHKQAAGVKLRESDIRLFEERINAIVKESLDGVDVTPTVELDAEISLSEVSANLVRELSLLEPLGFGNPEPLLGARRLDFQGARVVGNNHLKMRLKQRTMSIDAIGFGLGKFMEHLDSSILLDAAFTPTINEWNGGKYLQLNLKAFRPST